MPVVTSPSKGREPLYTKNVHNLSISSTQERSPKRNKRSEEGLREREARSVSRITQYFDRKSK